MAETVLRETQQKVKKCVKYEQKFKIDNRDELQCRTKSVSGDTFAFCNLCRCDVNIVHGALATQKHLNAASAAKFQPSLSSFASADRSAEVTRLNYCLRHS